MVLSVFDIDRPGVGVGVQIVHMREKDSPCAKGVRLGYMCEQRNRARAARIRGNATQKISEPLMHTDKHYWKNFKLNLQNLCNLWMNVFKRTAGTKHDSNRAALITPPFLFAVSCLARISHQKNVGKGLPLGHERAGYFFSLWGLMGYFMGYN